MQHFYKNIHGFFDYEDVYKEAINRLPNEAHIVEIGAFKGRSTAFMAIELINSGKKVQFDVIDTWNGDDGSNRNPWSDYTGMSGDIFEEFKENLKPVLHMINPIKMLSGDAVKLYEDKSLDFIFIDGHHSYEGVKSDIIAWLPKMKKNSYFCGHDYNKSSWPGVVKAVDEFFGNQVNLLGQSWVIHLK